MKKYLVSLGIFTFFIMIIPCLAFFIKPDVSASQDIQSFKNYYTEYYLDNSDNSEAVDTDVKPSKETTTMSKEIQPSEQIFLVMNYQTGEVMKVPAREYVIGAVCAEMPASFHEEALKAQAVAAHTYALRQMEKETLNPTKELKGAYFSNDPAKYQAYFTVDDAKAFYGEDFEENYNKVSSAVDSVINKVLTYENEPIVAAFHSMSSGKTEDASVIWGRKIDYLVPVDSSSDKDIDTYLTTVTFTQDELKARFSATYDDISFNKSPSKWMKVVEISDTGTVVSAIVGDKVLTGTEVREVLNLRSPTFDVSFNDGVFTITTKGYGHGVGLSQYGANAMAMNGSKYDEILLHYYKNVNLEDL